MFEYPYGNTEELNLDWILLKIKDLEERVAVLEGAEDNDNGGLG